VHTPSAPTPPNPVTTANAQTNMNIASAVGQQLTNAVNQQTPQGSLTYTQGGNRTWTETDANGKVHTYSVPILTATQTYSPQEQALYELGNKTQQNMGQIAYDESGRIGDLLSTPLDLSSTAIDDHLHSLYAPRIEAQQQRDRDALDSKLANQGFAVGSQGYATDHTLQGQKENDQWNQMYLNGRGEAVNEMLQQRQEPINELTALMSGSQVSNPNFGQTPSASIKPADYEGDVYQTYQAQMQNYQAQMAQSNAMMGGLFGTIGTLAGGWARSDRRLKSNITRLSTLPNGLGWYAYDIDGRSEEGVMADEVLGVNPHAVAVDQDGYLMVDYSRALA
jgi:hypothetical protein